MRPEQIAELLDHREKPHPKRQSVYIRSYRCTRDREGNVLKDHEDGGFAAVIVRDSPAVRQLLPEKYRDAEECILLYCHLDLTPGKQMPGNYWYLADEIDTYDGRCWQVVWAKRWHMYGFTQAVAVRTPRSFWERDFEEAGRSDLAEHYRQRRSGAYRQTAGSPA